MKFNISTYPIIPILFAALFLSSCKIGKQYTRPNLELPETLDSMSIDRKSVV